MRLHKTALAGIPLWQTALLFAALALILRMGYGAIETALVADAREAIDHIAARLQQIDRLNDLTQELRVQVHAARDQPSALRFLLVTADHSCPVATALCEDIGNLERWPQVTPDAYGRLQIAAANGHPSVEGRVVSVIDRLRLQLLIGRDLTVLDAFEETLAPKVLTMAVAAAVVSALFGLLAARRLLSRLEAINAFCRSLNDDSLDARLPVIGHDEFSELAANVNGMLNRIQDLVLRLRHSAKHVAHTLRTPLTSLRLTLELGLQRSQDAAAQATLETALVQLDGVLDIFARLLEIALNEAGGRADFAQVDLAAIVGTLLPMLTMLAEEAGVHIVTDLMPARMQGAAAPLQVLVMNVVSNAVKFSPPGGTVRIATREADGVVTLTVSDEGPGIPLAEHERVFDHFTRLSGTAGIQGHGLGLPLVRAIAQRHGLAIALEDNRPGLRVVMRGSAAASRTKMLVLA